MPRSDKGTVIRRVQDVVRLVLAGAEFAEIRQFESERGWDVSERQVRRYLETAYRRVAKVARRDRTQLLGRHLMQRRALYARALKENDIRTALQVLRDEAALQGLYPPTTLSLNAGDRAEPPFGRRERTVRLIMAEAHGDKADRRLLEHISPMRWYRLADTAIPTQLLHILTLIYVGEQLDQAAMFLHAAWRATVEEDPDGDWDIIGLISAYRFRIGREAWERFANRLGVDAGYLVRGNHQGLALEAFGRNICDLAPSADEVRTALAAMGQSTDDILTADILFRSWRRAFAEVCPE